MNNPLVSVLVPFYNVEMYVGKCVESLFKQTYSNIEYIFVDDCSPDRSMDIIKENLTRFNIAPSKYKIISHENNKGISFSRNDCLDNANGEYILFIDSDDWIELNMVELLVKEAVKSDADVVGCGYMEEYSDKTIKFPQKYVNDHEYMMKAITKLTIKGVMWKLLIRRSILVDNLVRFIPNNNMVDDYLFCCQVFYYAKSFASVDQCLYHYIQFNPNNYSHVTHFNIDSQAVAVIETEKFYKEKGVIDVVENELNERKFLLKLPLLLEKKCLDVNKWKSMFPESNGVWKSMDFSLGNRLIFRLAQSPFSFMASWIRMIR